MENQYVFFWRDYEENGYLSNWYKRNFIADGIIFNCMEQYFMYKKAELFKDYTIMDKILKEPKQRYQKALGRQVKNFNNEVWDKAKYNIVVNGLVAKFNSNKDLKEKLLATKDKKLIEASPFDLIWGIGLNKEDALKIDESKWPGENLLGLALMEARDILQK